MELASEDSFRLNVLLANRPQAIRIDESRLVVHGLSERGEATVALNPTGRPEQYLRLVRELISGHILGSPGGYPVYLRRWTRMGQMRDQSLAQLLMLGEPEAVVAAVGSPGLTEDLARRAWWALEDAGNARRMLANPTIVTSAMGPVLAVWLLDYLPFETEPEPIMASVRLVLQPGLLDERARLALWQKSARKQAYLVGFLQALPDALPQPLPARSDTARRGAALGGILGTATGTDMAMNQVAAALLRVVGSPGQTFLATTAAVLAKLPNQEVVTATFDLLRDYFAPLRPDGDPDLAIAALRADADRFAAGTPTVPESEAGLLSSPVRDCRDAYPQCAADLAAMRLLSGAGYGLLRPLLPDPTTQGTLMRRKLAPALEPLLAAIERLRRGDAG